MNRRVVSGALLLLMLASTLAFAVSESATMYMDKALKKRSKADYYGAISLLQMAIRIADRPSQRILAQFMLGDCLLETGKYREAKSVYEDALLNGVHGEEEAEARYRIAQCLSQLGDREKMSIACAELIDRFPRSPYSELAKSLKSTGTDPEPEMTVVRPAPSPEPEPPAPEEPAPEKPARAKPAPVARSAPEEPVEEPVQVAVITEEPEPAPAPAPAPRKPTPILPAAPADVVEMPRDLLAFPALSPQAREALATSILQKQAQLDPKRSGQDALLFDLASQTALFGEYLEACKMYDKLLNSYPRSEHVEQAYFEAIRLRVMLRAYDTAVVWAEAFRKTFPRSALVPALNRLSAFAAGQKGQRSPGKGDRRSEGLNDPRYREAKRKVESQRFSLALADFKALVKKFPETPRLWHELAIVQYQLKELDAAEESLGKLLSLDPEETIANEARSLLGHIYYLQGKVQKAVNEYKAAGKNNAPGLDYFNSESAALRIGKARGKQR